MFAPKAQRRLIALGAALAAGVAAVHLLIVVQDQQITLASQFALAVVAIGYAIFLITQRRLLRRTRYGALAAHAIGYVVVNGSYWLHAAYLWGSGQGAVIDSSWYGVLFGMSIGWGVGLVVHTIGAAASKGFEDARIA